MFGSQAGAYATSRVHMYDDRLDIMQRLAGNASVGDRTWAMDLGSGAGFTAFVMAAGFKRVVASDITGPMLVETRRIGRERGLTNLALVRNAAEYLPFASGSLDLVTSRAAIHHFEDLDRALDELHRVLRPGGSLVVADSISPEDSDLSEWMNDIELRRDFSHVNNRPVSELEAVLSQPRIWELWSGNTPAFTSSSTTGSSVQIRLRTRPESCGRTSSPLQARR